MIDQIEPVMDVNELISPSAYLLFYIRKDMTSVRFEDVIPSVDMPRFVRAGSSINGENSNETTTICSDEDMERFLKRRDSARCVLS